MKVKDTELEYTEADAVVLDYWLGGDAEDKEQWAKRVWDSCKEYQETDGQGYDGQGMSDVFMRTPYDIWESKKRRRRIRLHNELNGTKIPIDTETYPPELEDSKIVALKNHPHYKTRAQFENDRKAEIAQKRQDATAKKAQRLQFYIDQGRSVEDIILTHPELEHVIPKDK